MSDDNGVLLIGEIFVDFTLLRPNVDSKLRLGGIVHAARGLWAINQPFSVAAVCPGYLVDQARGYLHQMGCTEFVWLAEVKGSPNVMAIGDPTELADQAYQDLLRNEKIIEFKADKAALSKAKNCIIFPGKFSLTKLADLIPKDALVSFDIAYDLSDTDLLKVFGGRVSALITSTSSDLFLSYAADEISELFEELRRYQPTAILLKENRGGSRIYDESSKTVDEIPALLGETVNSVGVGDVYTAVFCTLLHTSVFDAAWKAARAATCYSQTTYPDDFKRDVQRSLSLSVKQMRGLGGTRLPWQARQKFSIYFAAPDFSYVDRTHIDAALAVLRYHNFHVRRPIQENGELDKSSLMNELQVTYQKDVTLLEECDVVFAVPFERDPGTLIEVGMALAAKKPVITFDPVEENTNTMVIAGSSTYSSDLDTCLNGLFDAMSKLRAARQ